MNMKFIPFILCMSLWACICNNVIAQETYITIMESRPIYGDLSIEWQIETIIYESDEDANYCFSLIMDLAIDDTENLLLLDKDRIIKYDKNGRFIRIIGRKGQGPGEYESPLSLFVDDHNNLYVNDSGRFLSVFSSAGDFINRILLNFQIPFDSTAFYVDRDGYIYAFLWDIIHMAVKKTLVKANKTGEVLSRIRMMDESAVRVAGSITGGVMGGLVHRYSSNSLFCPVGNSMLCFGENIEYQLFFADYDGHIKTVFHNDEKTESISYEEKRVLGNKADFPPHRPFFNKLLSDEKGRIYVVRTKSVLNRSRAVKVDVLSKKGQFMYTTIFPAEPMVIKRGAVYYVDEDQENKRILKRAIIHNYKYLKED